MKRIILLELCLLFLATTFQGDRLIGWVQQTIPRQDLAVRDLQFVDTLTGFLIQSRVNPDSSFISRTTDGGNNWSVTQLPNVYLTSLHFINELTGFCAGGEITTSDPGVVIKTTNGGNNWFTNSYVSSFIFLNDVVFINNDTGWVCSTYPLDGGLWRTTNGGISWQMQMNYVPSPSKVFFVNDTIGWVIGSANSTLYKTTNCGINWNVQQTIYSLSDIFFTSTDTGYLVKDVGSGTTSLMSTSNGGSNWFAVNIQIVPTTSRLFFINNKIGWAGAGFNKVAATKDGYNWGIQSSPIRNYSVSFTDSLHGWAGYSGLVRTTDGGGTIVSAIELLTDNPKEFELGQNYPNPFNALSKIKYKILKSSEVRITVYDIMGKKVAILLNEKKKPGEYAVSFNGNNLPSGIYFYALFADGKRIYTKKMSLIK